MTTQKLTPEEAARVLKEQIIEDKRKADHAMLEEQKAIADALTKASGEGENKKPSKSEKKEGKKKRKERRKAEQKAQMEKLKSERKASAENYF